MKALPLSLGAALLCSVAAAQPVPPSTGSTTPNAAMPANPNRATMPLATPGASGQLSPGNNSSTTPPAVTTSNADQRTSAAPVRGRNSFTMGEARRRIERSGFTQVTGLKKDQDGIWRGKGMRGGQSMNVFCDYQGNVGGS